MEIDKDDIQILPFNDAVNFIKTLPISEFKLKLYDYSFDFDSVDEGTYKNNI